MNRSAFDDWTERNRQAIARLKQQIKREKAQAQIGAPTVRQAGGTGMELTQAQHDWLFEFRDKVSNVERAFHYAANAHDVRRANRHAEEQDRLNQESTVKDNKHTDALRYLTEWVKAHPYPTADQTAPTVADNLKEANRLANLADERQQYRNGWKETMAAIEDVQTRGNDARAWADSLRFGIRLGKRKETHTDQQNHGAIAALTHFLTTGQTDRHAP